MKDAATVVLAPDALADLLGVDRADAGLLATAPVRLPAAWVDDWRTRLGPLELTVPMAAVILGNSPRTLWDWIKAARLAARRRGRVYIVSPAALVECQRSHNAGTVPVPVTTPAQERRRARAAKDRAARMIAGG